MSIKNVSWKLKKNNKIIGTTSTIFEGIIFSLLLIYITARLKIIDPRYTDWLQVGDGTMEISWEFFRNQPIWQFPLGLNPNYGLEISSTLVFDGQIPIFSLIFHPFSPFLFERFQYVGLFLFFCFVLNYIVSKIIFLKLNLNLINSSLASVILATSPIILNRYIEGTHYGLTSAFLILLAILLVINNDSSLYKWASLYLSCLSVFLYYIVFIALIHVLFLSFRIYKKQETIGVVSLKMITISVSNFLFMYVVGYFYGGNSAKDIGFGVYKATLSSLIDPSGWSILIPDIPEASGAYEGFAYLGLPSIIMLIMVLYFRLRTPNNKIHVEIHFKILFIAAGILFFLSLSNKISISTFEIFEYRIPPIVENYFLTFRSSGRFAWLLVLLIFIWLTRHISLLVEPKRHTLILILLITVSFLDSGKQLFSQRDVKFSLKYVSDLKNSGWTEIGNCYSKLRIYPPGPAVDNYYNFVNLALQQDLAINTGRYGRTSVEKNYAAFIKMEKDFALGTLEADSFYVFSSAYYTPEDVVNFHKNNASFSLNDLSGMGSMDGFTYIAPMLKNCQNVPNLISNTNRFGVDIENKYSGGLLTFGIGKDARKYVLSGFSQLQEWGVWSVGNNSDIYLNLQEGISASRISINAKSLVQNSETAVVKILVNDKVRGECNLRESFSICEIDSILDFNQKGIVKISFQNLNSISFRELGLSDDGTEFGIGINSLELS
jgi:hypothetical protein